MLQYVRHRNEEPGFEMELLASIWFPAALAKNRAQRLGHRVLNMISKLILDTTSCKKQCLPQGSRESQETLMTIIIVNHTTQRPPY